MEQENMNSIYKKMHYIDWSKEATRVVLTQDEIKSKYLELKSLRKPENSQKKRDNYITEQTYRIENRGDYFNIYLVEGGKYIIYSTNVVDEKKNTKKKLDCRPDILFDMKFRELNRLSLRKAFGFVNKDFKRCIPMQFYYKTDRHSIVNHASSIDASSQYPSGCLGTLPDFHTAIPVRGTVKPTAEYPFAFYASGHLAIYNELDTHDWMLSKFAKNLFRLDKNDEYRLQPCKPEDDCTILMKASEYTMNDTWNFFYEQKKNCAKDSDEYNEAKTIMNATIGNWHRKDKNKKAAFTYDDHGSYQLAHIVAVAIARGNQKILNKVNEIGFTRILHICVDGIIYEGKDIQGISESKFGQFAQEFNDCKFRMLDYNVYAAEKDGIPVKFKHGGFDLIYGHEIDDTIKYGIKDLEHLSSKERITDILWDEK